MKSPPIHPRATAIPPTPTDFSAAMQKWWQQVVAAYELEPHHLLMLEGACRAWDRAVEARAVLTEQGLSYTDGHDRIHPRPEANMERRSMLTFARLLRELDLDVAPPPAERLSRPPGLKSNR